MKSFVRVGPALPSSAIGSSVERLHVVYRAARGTLRLGQLSQDSGQLGIVALFSAAPWLFPKFFDEEAISLRVDTLR